VFGRSNNARDRKYNLKTCTTINLEDLGVDGRIILKCKKGKAIPLQA
jgi:hypothetical protein